MLKYTTTTQQKERFNALYDRYAGAFYGELKRNLYQPDLCNQTLEAAFQQVWKKMADLGENEQPSFIWCYQIVRREMIKKKVELTIKELLACQRKISKAG